MSADVFDLSTRESAVAAVQSFILRLPYPIWADVTMLTVEEEWPTPALILRRVLERVIGRNGEHVAALAEAAERWEITQDDIGDVAGRVPARTPVDGSLV